MHMSPEELFAANLLPPTFGADVEARRARVIEISEEAEAVVLSPPMVDEDRIEGLVTITDELMGYLYDFLLYQLDAEMPIDFEQINIDSEALRTLAVSTGELHASKAADVGVITTPLRECLGRCVSEYALDERIVGFVESVLEQATWLETALHIRMVRECMDGYVAVCKEEVRRRAVRLPELRADLAHAVECYTKFADDALEFKKVTDEGDLSSVDPQTRQERSNSVAVLDHMIGKLEGGLQVIRDAAERYERVRLRSVTDWNARLAYAVVEAERAEPVEPDEWLTKKRLRGATWELMLSCAEGLLAQKAQERAEVVQQLHAVMNDASQTLDQLGELESAASVPLTPNTEAVVTQKFDVSKSAIVQHETKVEELSEIVRRYTDEIAALNEQKGLAKAKAEVCPYTSDSIARTLVDTVFSKGSACVLPAVELCENGEYDSSLRLAELEYQMMGGADFGMFD